MSSTEEIIGEELSPSRLSGEQLSPTGPLRAPARSMNDVTHPRGRILPLLDVETPLPRRAVRGIVRLGQGLYYHDVFRAAPAMAFHFFLSLLPLMAFIGYVVGTLAHRHGVTTILALVLDSFPPTTAAVIAQEVANLGNADRLGPLAAIGFLWIAAGGVHGLMDAVEMVVGAPHRSWFKQRLYAFGWVVATLLIFGIASSAIIQWDSVLQAGDGQARHFLRAEGQRWLPMAVSLAFAIGFLCAFYRFAVTHSSKVRRRVLPGALTATLLWIVVSWGFTIYVRSLVNYAVYYGSLAAVALLLVWLWLMSLAILVGAELNSQLEGLRD